MPRSRRCYPLFSGLETFPSWVGYRFNPCPAELLQYFSSFEAGIANAISSFK